MHKGPERQLWKNRRKLRVFHILNGFQRLFNVKSTLYPQTINSLVVKTQKAQMQALCKSEEFADLVDKSTNL